MDNTTEAIETISQALNGNWIPLGLIFAMGSFGYWISSKYIDKILSEFSKQHESQSEKNKITDVILEKLTNTMVGVEKLLVKIETVQEGHERRIRDTELDVSQILLIKQAEEIEEKAYKKARRNT